MSHSYTPHAVAALAAPAYRGESLATRFMQYGRPFISPFHTLLPLFPEGARVFDVGCGRGLMLLLLAQYERLAEGVGFDIDGGVITEAARARDRLARDVAGRVQFHHCPIGTPWPAGVFDVVSMVDVLHHVPPAAQEFVVREALARVAPGGMFIYKDMCQTPRWRAAFNRLHDLVVARQWIAYRAVADVEAWARQAGFTLTMQRDESMLWYGHELRVFRKPSI